MKTYAKAFRRRTLRGALCVAFATLGAQAFAAAAAPVVHTWTGADKTKPLEWNVAANWSTKAVPTNAADTCVFDIGSGKSIAVTRTKLPGEQLLPSITVKSGTLTLSELLNLPRDRATAYSPSHVTNVFDVAEGATLLTLNTIGPSGITKVSACGVRKTGRGTWSHTGNIGAASNSKVLKVIEVSEGLALLNTTTPFVNCIIVRDGATYRNDTAKAMEEYNIFQIDRGGQVRLNAAEGTVPARGITGEGDFVVQSGGENNFVTFHLDNQYSPYRFSGRVWSDYAGGSVTFRMGAGAKVRKPSETTKYFTAGSYVICASNTLAATDGAGSIVFNPVIAPTWGSGVGDFWSMPIVGRLGVPIPTQDEARQPITLHAAIDANTALTGSGSWFSWGGTSTITGQQIRVSGAIGSDPSGTLVLGSGLDPADDVNWYDYSIVPNGSITFNNVAAQTIREALAVGETLSVAGPVTFERDVTASAVRVPGAAEFRGAVTATNDIASSGTMTVAGSVKAGGSATLGGVTTIGGNLTVTGRTDFQGTTTVGGELKTGILSVNAPTTVGRYETAELTSGVESDLTLRSGLIRGDIVVGAGTLTLENTRVYRDHSLVPRREPIYTSGWPLGVRIDGTVVGSKLMVGRGAAVCTTNLFLSFGVRDGGRLLLQQSAWSLGSMLSAATVTLDGGTVDMTGFLATDPASSSYSYTFPDNSCADKWTLSVGAKGGTFESRASVANGLQGALCYNDDLAAVSGVSGDRDGGLAYDVPATYNIRKPKKITGPLTVRGGLIRFKKAALYSSGGNAISGGSIVLDGGALTFGDDLTKAQNPVLANATKATFTFRGASAFELGQDDGNGEFKARTLAQSYKIGPSSGATSTPFVRGGKGSVLFISDRLNSKAIGSSNKVLVNGGMSVNSDATLREPIFSERNAFLRFFKWGGASSGIIELPDTSYSTSLTAGASKFVWINQLKKTLSSNATIAGLRLDFASGRFITINSGKTLTVGGGTYPAAILFSVSTSLVSSKIKYVDAITGAGAIDFGNSEGVFAVARRNNTSRNPAPKVSVTVRGQNGLTIAGSPLGSDPLFYLSGQNEYRNGTFIDMVEVVSENKASFGDGLVTVRGRRLQGGAVGFNLADVTYANDFKITGWGRNADIINCADDYGYGALHFRQDGVCLAGDVTVDDYARITSVEAPANSVSTFSGSISGDDLQFFFGYPEGKKFVLEGANAVSGLVEIVKANVVLSGAHASLGTGEVLVDKGLLEFDNTQDIVFPNDMRGNGTVKLHGPSVRFTGDTNLDENRELVLDLADTSPTIKWMPPFATITNSSEKVARVTIGTDLTIDPSKYRYITPNVRLCLDGVTLDLSGQTLTVERAKRTNGGQVVNGTLIETNPSRALGIIVR